jgi:Tropinone reductase 1
LARPVLRISVAWPATVLTCARNATELHACEKEWSAKGYDVHTVVSDMSSDEGRNALITAIDAKLGGTVRCLVNNVGSNIRKRAIEYSEPEYEHIMRTNLKSAFALTVAGTTHST